MGEIVVNSQQIRHATTLTQHSTVHAYSVGSYKSEPRVHGCGPRGVYSQRST